MLLSPEIILRQVIARGLAILRDNSALVEHLMKVEEKFWPGITERFVSNLKEFPEIPVVTNWPESEGSIPVISVIVESSEESLAFVGDMAGIEHLDAAFGSVAGGLEDSETGLRNFALAEVIGVLDSASYNVIITTLNPEFTSLLTSLVRFMIFHAKLRMEHLYGIRDIELSDHDFQYPHEYWPQQVWSKAVSIKAKVDRTGSTWHLRHEQDDEMWKSVYYEVSDFVVNLVPSEGIVVVPEP